MVSFQNDINRRYVGKKFPQAVESIYANHGILLIGIRSLSSSDQSEVSYFDVLMNPNNYVIKQQDEAIIISNDQEAANSIWGEDNTV